MITYKLYNDLYSYCLLSTGKAFCGNYGSKGHNRREYLFTLLFLPFFDEDRYTVIGDSVNTSARIMTKANKDVQESGR